MSEDIWNGSEFVSRPEELKSKCRYCGYCGAKMREILHPNTQFDRVTGKQSKAGTLFWQCPNRGVGLDAIRGDWMNEYDENPHDATRLREADIP